MAQQPSIIELFEEAVKGFRETLRGVKSDQMSNATPCPDWNVQALLNHNIRVEGFAHGVLTGNITVNPMDVSGALTAEGALEALDAGVARNLELIKTAGFMDKELDTPFGQMTAAQFMFNPFTDLLIHKWDLAKGTGQSTTLDSGLVGACFGGLSPVIDNFRGEVMPGVHVFGPNVAVPDSASAQDKLIGLTGRNP
jgi:uncharacterized protein (TIGR03086 family)